LVWRSGAEKWVAVSPTQRFGYVFGQEASTIARRLWSRLRVPPPGEEQPADEMWDPALQPLTLRRKTLDYVDALSTIAFSGVFDDPTLRRGVVDLLMDLFDSPDGTVRRRSIALVRELCDREIPEAALLLRAAGTASSRLMKEITMRLADPLYLDKPALNDLLKWYFARTGKNAAMRR
jgi:hypothetical protein